MSLRITREVLQHESSLGGKIPLVLSAPSDLALDHKLPVVLLLHDTLDTGTPSEFVEVALQFAHKLLEPMSQSQPMILAQPFGAGNSGWLGWGAVQFFDAISQIKLSYDCDLDKISLLGIGSGATGALLLAQWFPEYFSAIALIGAATDPGLELPFGVEDWPKWERGQRKSFEPLALARNLSTISIYSAHPWWFDGTGNTASKDHQAALLARLKREQIPVELEPQPFALAMRNKELLPKPKELLQWLTAKKRNPRPDSFRFRTHSLRSPGAFGVQIQSMLKVGDRASFDFQCSGAEVKIQTAGIASLALDLNQLATNKISTIVIDETQWGVSQEMAHAGRLVVEKWDKRWQLHPQEDRDNLGSRLPYSIDSRTAGSPACNFDLRWAPVAIVPGTLGDDFENSVLQNCSRQIQLRLQSGADSLNLHPGLRNLPFEIPIVKDTDVTEQMIVRRNLILLGNPTSNLLLARYAADLPCSWATPNEEGATENLAFTLAGKTYVNARDGVCFLSQNPEVKHRSVLIYSGVSIEAIRDLAIQNTTFFPDYLVARKKEVLDWGYFERG